MNLNTESIYILKLGGSLITNKNEPFSLRRKIIKNIVSEIIESEKKTIIIHGGGAYGHPIAKKYNINSGKDNSIKNQIYGLARTHNVMTELNKYIVDEFLERKISAVSIAPSSIFIKDREKGIQFNSEIIKLFINLKITPILYGDIILTRDGDFSILSGDTIILKLCQKLEDYNIKKVIFSMEVDGLYIRDSVNENIELAKVIEPKQIKTLSIANLGQKIDITGGMKLKLDNINKITLLGIPVQLINGKKKNNIRNALKGEASIGTYFKPS